MRSNVPPFVNETGQDIRYVELHLPLRLDPSPLRVCIEATGHYHDHRPATWQLLVQAAPAVWLTKDVCDECAERAWPGHSDGIGPGNPLPRARNLRPADPDPLERTDR